MEDDPFERMLRHEEEIRRRVQSGEIDDDEAAELRDLADADDDGPDGDGRLRLTVEQIARVVDGGVEPSALRTLLSLSPALSTDDAIALCADYDPDLDLLRDMASSSGLRLGRREIIAVLDAGVEGDTLAAAVAYGSDDPVATAVLLTEHANDPDAVLDGLRELDITGLSDRQLAKLVDNDIDPHVLAAMLDASPGLSADQAIDLCIRDVDPDLVARLADR